MKNIFIAVILSIILSTLIGLYGGNTAGDDTFIYMRYVENFIQTGFYQYNVGEESFGITSFLWPVLMTPVVNIFGNDVLTWKLTGLFFVFLRVSITFLFFVYFGLKIIPSLALTLLSFSEPHSIRWLSAGMENSLAIFLLTLLFILLLLNHIKNKNHSIVIGLICGLLPFARPEFFLYGIGIIIFLFLMKDVSRYRMLFSFFITIILFLLFIWWFTGNIIPQSALAKSLSLANSFSYVFTQSVKIILSGAIGSLLIMLFYKILEKNMRYLRIIVLLSLIVSLVYLIYASHLISTRYSLFLCFPIVLASSFFIAEKIKLSRLTNTLKIFVILQVLVTILVLIYVFPITRVSETSDIKEVAEFIRENTDKDAKIALTEIGGLGFYSDRYIIDIIGLTDKKSLQFIKQNGFPSGTESLEKLLEYRKADYFIDCFAGKDNLKGSLFDFIPVESFYVTRNNLSEGKPITYLWRIYKLNKTSNS